MPDENDKQPVLSLADHAAAFTGAENDVQRLERDREGIVAKLAQLDAEIASAKQKRDAAHAGLRGSL